MEKDFIVRRSITVVEGKPHVETYSEQELVRCKDCDKAEVLSDQVICCNLRNTECQSYPLDFFCADGERRTDDA